MTQPARVSLVVPRLDAKPWGGRGLERYGLDLPAGEKIGEALVTAGEAVITAGDGAGRTIDALVREDPAGRLGARGHAAVSERDTFPLLVKLIDAAENLSIQVHPDDDGARPLDRLGKTEAWYVLDAAPGSKLYLGLRAGAGFEDFSAAAQKLDGSSAAYLRAIDAAPGMTVLIPAGTVHALGAGVMVYEIQQPSDVTFRLDDWGRVDAQGRPREMHLDQGFVATRPELRPERIDPVPVRDAVASRHLLAACRYFALERISLPAGGSIDAGGAESPQVVTVLSGGASLCGGDDVALTPGSSGVVWSTATPARLTATAPAVVLRAWVPDLAVEVVAPAEQAGAEASAIADLGGATGDVARVTVGS
ncbi:MAG TPA: type I phosphomannose isomerase catalytic subunit [Thermomicrobiales bacterium]|nr:type I phosphomannose isomerase catalytic subunit [Thermomicrobiales bacterium]